MANDAYLLAESVDKVRQLGDDITNWHRVLPVGIGLIIVAALSFVMWRYVVKDFLHVAWSILREAFLLGRHGTNDDDETNQPTGD